MSYGVTTKTVHKKLRLDKRANSENWYARLRWKNIEWYKHDGEHYLVVNFDGKTKGRSVVARDKVEHYLDRQRQHESRWSADVAATRCLAKSID